MKWLPFPVFAGLALIGSTAMAQTTLLTTATNNIYDTGLANGGANLAIGSTDPHYILTFNPSATGSNALVTSLAGGWIASQTGTTPPSSWISFSSSAASGPNAVYDYQLTLTNIPLTQVVTITGSVAADDQITINANGLTKYSHLSASYSAFTSFSFTFDSGTTTTDTLDFLVNNTGSGPTGLQLNNLAGSYTVVPEAKDMAAIYLVGGCMLIVIARSRKLLFS